MAEDGSIVRIFVDKAMDPSEWIQNRPCSHSLNVELSGIPAGNYTWLVGLVDTMKGNIVGLNIAVDKKSLTSDGWMKVGNIALQ